MVFISQQPGFGVSQFVKRLAFTRAADFNTDRQSLPNVFFLGFYEEEWNAYKMALRYNDVRTCSAFDEEISERTIAQFLTFEDPGMPNPKTVILRHVDSVSGLTAIKGTPISSILSGAALAKSVFDVEISDVDLSNHFWWNWNVDIPLTRLLRSDTLSSLTLLRVSIPWAAFSFFPSLESLDVENVTINGVLGIFENQRPVFSHRQELKGLRWFNSTELIHSLLSREQAHGLSFDKLEALECDMGSWTSVQCATILMHRSHLSLQSLGFDLEANSDELALVGGLSDSDTTGLAFPKLALLKVGDAYRMDDFNPFLRVLDALEWTCRIDGQQAPLCPALSAVSLSIKKLPILCLPDSEGIPEIVQGLNVVRMVMEAQFQGLDAYLYHFLEGDAGYRAFSLEVTLDPVTGFREILAVHDTLRATDESLFSQINSEFASKFWSEEDLQSLMDNLGRVPTDSDSWTIDEKGELEKEFLRFFMGKAWMLKSLGIAHVGLEFALDEAD